jgi:hypothetical protein
MRLLAGRHRHVQAVNSALEDGDRIFCRVCAAVRTRLDAGVKPRLTELRCRYGEILDASSVVILPAG